jgi:hypothetical protein
MLIVDLSSDLSPSPSSNHQIVNHHVRSRAWVDGEGVGCGLEIIVS